ncbi:MAG TPA: DUF485 domain-containing protein [Abditibacteriaceae bacterium]
MSKVKRDTLQSEDFLKLARQKGQISGVLTALAMLSYFGFIFLLAFQRDVLARRVSSGVNLGIPLGIGVIIVSWILTGIYVKWANSSYDSMIETVKSRHEIDTAAETKAAGGQA